MNIPFKSLLKKFKNIDNRNAAFEKLTKEQQRQEIAYDALLLVISKRVTAMRGFYWSSSLTNICYMSSTSKDFQKNLLKVPECRVCQRGLMMLSQIRLSNTVSPDDSSYYMGDNENIKGFTYKTFIKLEEEYEDDKYDTGYGIHTNKKLANICCNIIANGNFKTSDKKDYLKLWDIKI